jgi:hypothetical protein
LLPQFPQLLGSVWVQTFWPLHITGLAHPPDDEDAAAVLELEGPPVLLEEGPPVLLEEGPPVLLDEGPLVVVELEVVVAPPLPLPPPDVEELAGVAPPFESDPPSPTMPPAPPLPVDVGPPLFVDTPPMPLDEELLPAPEPFSLPPESQPTIAKAVATAVEVTGFNHLYNHLCRALRIIGRHPNIPPSPFCAIRSVERRSAVRSLQA